MTADMMSPGEVFGDFEIRALLGRGGMGVVYRAFDAQRGGEVALKVLASNLTSDRTFAERFRREARTAAELSDPHVVPVYRFGDTAGQLFMSMALIRGRDAAELVRVSGRLRADRVVTITRQAAHALDAAHAANLIHRDVKPSNLLIVENRDDFTYLADFGIAHVIGSGTAVTSLTSTGATIGTLAYMAPERFESDSQIDGRVDVYALACVVFEMLTGTPPFPYTDHAKMMAAHLLTFPPAVTRSRPDLPTDWDELVARGMAKDPDDRYATAGELASEARRILARSAPAPVVPAGASAVSTTPGSAAAPATDAAEPGQRADDGPVDAKPPDPASPDPASPDPASPDPASPAETEAPARTPPPRAQSRGRWIGGVALVLVVSAAVVVGVMNYGSEAGLDRSVDLGLATPLAPVSCDGGYAVLLASIRASNSAPASVGEVLRAHPGARYLLAGDDCTSPGSATRSTAATYTVYYGPYPTLGEACAAQKRAGGDSSVRFLDRTTPASFKPSC